MRLEAGERVERMVQGRAELRGLAEELAPHLRPGRVVALSGPMGAGKTTLVRELVDVLGLDAAQVRSPTFSLVNVYDANGRRAYHVDLYRAESEGDLAGIDLEEVLYDPEAFAFIEWPERLLARLPPGHLRVELAFAPDAGPEARRVTLEAYWGDGAARGRHLS